MAAATTTPATPAPPMHWKDRGIAMAGAISDAYDVLMAYAGHSSRFILITCMIANILEVIPTIHLPELVVNTVLVVQVLTLDIGGLSLSSMAKHAKEQGNAQAARTAGATSMLLIGLTMATLVLVSIGTIWPSTKAWTGTAEQVLILIRIAMVIVYSHVVHSLREALQKHQQKQADQAAEIARLQQEASDLQTKLQAELTAAQQQQEQATLQITTLQGQLQEAQKNGSDLHLSWQEKELSLKAEMKAQQTKMEAQKLSLESQMKAEMEAQKLSLEARMEAEVKAQKLALKAEMEATMKAQQEHMAAELEALKQTNAHLKAKMKAQTEAPVKPASKVPPEKFDARQFVFSCLRESPDLKISEIALKAKKHSQELSEPTISRYRKEYRESSHESSAV